MDKFDFGGWATKYGVPCTDGRTISREAFKSNNGKTVPLVYNHLHNSLENVLGNAVLEHRDEGVYARCTFNDTKYGQLARILVQHGDLDSLSIYANQLKQRGNDVVHGEIRELSLVLAGANPQAFIDTIIAHSDDADEEAIIAMGYHIETLVHSDKEDEKDKATKETLEDKKPKEEKPKEMDIVKIFESMTEEQKETVYALVGRALKKNVKINDDEKEDKEDKEMKHNVFDPEPSDKDNTLSHDAMNTIIGDAKRFGSMKESFLQHSATYGIGQIDYLYPDAKNVTPAPGFIARDMSWVQKVMQGVHHTPFSRIKSIFADITEDDARAKGYIKGKMKKEEFFALIKRTTTPTTVYKKQKMDRDDVVDIVDFDVVSWLKSEMRMMLDEELARAYLVGDGRVASSDDKINEGNIRPIWKDENIYTIKAAVDASKAATDDEKAKLFIRQCIKSRKEYKGSGQPTLYTTEDMLTDMLLLEDTTGRTLYPDEVALARKLRVKEIVTVPVMENQSRDDTDGNTYELLGIIVNLADYNVGADKGGAINMFEDFDIDYNQQKYLIETRCSGALTRPYSAIAVELKKTKVTPTQINSSTDSKPTA